MDEDEIQSLNLAAAEEYGPEDELEDAEPEDVDEELLDELGDQEPVEGVEAEEEVEPEQPQSVYVDPGETVAEAKLRELLADPEVSAALDAAMEAKINKRFASHSAAQVHVTAAAVQHPELFRVYGAKLNSYLAEQPDAVRGQKLGMDAAIARLVLEESQKSDPATAMGKIYGMMGKQAQKAPKAPIPAAQRPPSPSTGTAPTTSARESKIKFIMREMGVSRSEAEESLSALSTSSGRR